MVISCYIKKGNCHYSTRVPACRQLYNVGGFCVSIRPNFLFFKPVQKNEKTSLATSKTCVHCFFI